MHRHASTKSSAGTPALHEAIDRFACPRGVGRDCNTVETGGVGRHGVPAPCPSGPGCATSAVVIAMVRPPRGGVGGGACREP